jgi:hypothetical protein
MVVIILLEKTYMLKGVYIPEYYLGENLERRTPWKSMEESRINISSFCKDLYPKHHTEI